MLSKLTASASHATVATITWMERSTWFLPLVGTYAVLIGIIFTA